MDGDDARDHGSEEGGDDTSQNQLAPLSFFLASSFNVELVYIILKGITQFSFIRENEVLKKKINVQHHGENVTITINKIKIKNQEEWSSYRTSAEINAKLVE